MTGRQRIGAYALCMQHSPTVAALSTSFLLNHAPNSPELNALITRFREARKLKKSISDWLKSGNALIQHLSEKNEIFVFPRFFQVVQKHKLFGVAR